MEAAFGVLINEALAQPAVFVHAIITSRNLMADGTYPARHLFQERCRARLVTTSVLPPC